MLIFQASDWSALMNPAMSLVEIGYGSFRVLSSNICYDVWIFESAVDCLVEKEVTLAVTNSRNCE